MATKSLNPPLVVIVGETASGKTAASIKLAKKINGEIICADSRTIYKGMDIGTAKPTKDEQSGVPHHLLDLLNPDETFSAAAFKDQAQKCIQEIISRNHVPIVVGGTGLYIDSLLYNYHFTSRRDEALRMKLELKNDEELTTFINDNKIDVSNVNTKNRRHLIRFIERGGISPKDLEFRSNTAVFGIKLHKEVLEKRIKQRVEDMFNNGFLDEVAWVTERYGWDNSSMTGIGYRVAREYFEGNASQDDVKRAFVSRDMSLAKRQRTWFRRNKNIIWLDNPDAIIEQATKFVGSDST